MSIEDEIHVENRRAMMEGAYPQASPPASGSALRDAIERDIKAIASIYPTAFDLYDEPLELLVGRLQRTFLKQNAQCPPTQP